MSEEDVATRIVVFFSEDDRVGHHGLHQVLLEKAREGGMAGATLWRGVEGFGASGRLRSNRFPDATRGLPLALEVVDSPDRIDAFLAEVGRVAPGCLTTREQVRTSRPNTR